MGKSLIKNFSGFLYSFCEKISNFAKNFENYPNNAPEIAALILYFIFYFVFTFFHEPWFDEAQAWQIAKCASLHDILFYLPHFEGHPPLWHLVLAPFAKLNFPYEITLKTISFIFSYLTIFLIVFKSPFLRIIKILIPFTYFYLYQDAIIARPYCMVMLAFCLVSMFWIERIKKTAGYILSLIFLSLTHSFAFIISSMLFIIWFFEIVKNKCFKKNLWLIFLFCLISIFTIFLLIPDKSAFALSLSFKSSIFKRLLYSFFIIPTDALLTNTCAWLPEEKFPILEFLAPLALGVLFWYFIFALSKNKSVLGAFLIPYIPFSIVASRYFSIQHIGIITAFIIFFFWINQQTKTQKQKEFYLKNCFILFIFFCFIIQFYWCFKSCLTDTVITYSTGRNEAKFIKKHGLDNYKIMVQWHTADDNPTSGDKRTNPNINGIYETIAPYFKKNIFYNFQYGRDDKNYVLHKIATKKEVDETYSNWKKQGYPDVIVGNAKIEEIFPEKQLGSDYILVYHEEYSYILKGIKNFPSASSIFVEKELAKKLNLEKITPKVKDYKFDFSDLIAKITYTILEYKNCGGKN